MRRLVEMLQLADEGDTPQQASHHHPRQTALERAIRQQHDGDPRHRIELHLHRDGPEMGGGQHRYFGMIEQIEIIGESGLRQDLPRVIRPREPEGDQPGQGHIKPIERHDARRAADVEACQHRGFRHGPGRPRHRRGGTDRERDHKARDHIKHPDPQPAEGQNIGMLGNHRSHRQSAQGIDPVITRPAGTSPTAAPTARPPGARDHGAGRSRPGMGSGMGSGMGCGMVSHRGQPRACQHGFHRSPFRPRQPALRTGSGHLCAHFLQPVPAGGRRRTLVA